MNEQPTKTPETDAEAAKVAGDYYLAGTVSKEFASQLEIQRDEHYARAASLVFALPDSTLAGAVQRWRDEYRADREKLVAERDAADKIVAQLQARLADEIRAKQERGEMVVELQAKVASYETPQPDEEVQAALDYAKEIESSFKDLYFSSDRHFVRLAAAYRQQAVKLAHFESAKEITGIEKVDTIEFWDIEGHPEGAAQVEHREHIPSGTRVFILPPSATTKGSES